MTIYRLIFYVCFLTFPLTVNSQADSLKKISQIDSLRTKLKSDSLHIFRFQKYRPFFNIDQRNSFIRSAPINVNGIQLGLIIRERHTIGLGGYMITSRKMVKIKTDNNIEVNRTLNLDYGTIFYQYTAIDKRYFELDLQIETGFGKYDIVLTNPTTLKTVFERKAWFGVLGAGPIIAIKPLKWVGIGGMLGYRLTFERNSNLNFNGFFYGYGLWLDLRQIIRDVNFYWIKKAKYKKQIAALTF